MLVATIYKEEGKILKETSSMSISKTFHYGIYQTYIKVERVVRTVNLYTITSSAIINSWPILFHLLKLTFLLLSALFWSKYQTVCYFIRESVWSLTEKDFLKNHNTIIPHKNANGDFLIKHSWFGWRGTWESIPVTGALLSFPEFAL